MKYLAFLFTLFIVLVIILADINALPPFVRSFYDFPNGDKVGHLVLFGLLNFFLTSAFLSRFNPDPKRVALSVGLILALAIAAEEYSQQYFSARTFDLVDLLAGYVGVVAGGWIALRLKK
ncbi:MAG: VanZ family protein [Anaerolineales bacterium]|nr:VanZ family protein [Anaerolineales bacterium]MCB9145143.1 VanZ family protein [Anaerolineales bacterium]